VLRPKSQLSDYSETFFKGMHDAFHGINHRNKPVSEGVVVSAWPRNLLNSYINYEIGICLYFHAWPVTNKTKARDFVFVFQKSRVVDFHVGKPGTGGIAKFGTKVRSPRRQDVKFPMPVYACPVMQNSQTAPMVKDQLLWREVGGSIVRLYSLDDAPTLWLEWSNFRSGILETLSCATDRKLQVLLIGGRIASAINDSGAIHARIKGGPKLVENLAQLESEDWRETVVDWRSPDAPCPVVIHAHAGAIEVFFRNNVIPELPEGFAVGVCPLNAIPALLKSPWHQERDYTREHLG